MKIKNVESPGRIKSITDFSKFSLKSNFLLSMESQELTKGPNPLLRRRNSIATPVVVPDKLTLPTKPHHVASFPNGTAASSSTSSSLSQSDFELISMKPSSYTSLKDLLPFAAVQSPTAGTPSCQSGYEISIRNRLVKQAAWAYLRPMSTSPGSADGHFLLRLWGKISGKNQATSFLHSITQSLTRAFDQLLRCFG